MTLVVQQGANSRRDKEASIQKEASDWREALSKVSVSKTDSPIGAFEMESFLDDDKYADKARSIAASLLPSVADPQEFDAGFFVLLKGTNADNQNEIIGIARSLTDTQETLKNKALNASKGKAHTKDQSFDNFIMHPQEFFDEHN
jgi:hypothetical protein